MVELKNPWKVFGKIALTVGGIFLTAFIIVFVLSHYQLSGLTKALGINGALWIVWGSVLLQYCKRISSKLLRLKSDGFMYEAKIERLHKSLLVRIIGYTTVFAECSYKNKGNKICMVKSRLFLQDCPNDSLRAMVYVDKSNPMDYSVELFVGTKNNAQYDHEYRNKHEI